MGFFWKVYNLIFYLNPDPNWAKWRSDSQVLPIVKPNSDTPAVWCGAVRMCASVVVW